VKYVQTERHDCEVETGRVEVPTGAGLEALTRNVIGQFQQIVSSRRRCRTSFRRLQRISRSRAGWLILWRRRCRLTTDDKQQLLESASIQERLEKLMRISPRSWRCQQLRTKIQTEVQDQVQQSQRTTTCANS